MTKYTLVGYEGEWVSAADYDALAARLAEAENLLRDVREQVPTLPTVLGVALRSYLDRASDSASLTRDFHETVDARAARDPEFAAALAAEVQPSAATENPEAMYSPVAREGHAGASARQIDVAAGDQLVAGQPERCCLDYPRCDCNSPPEPDNAPALQPCGHPWKAQHDSKCILCSSPGVTP